MTRRKLMSEVGSEGFAYAGICLSCMTDPFLRQAYSNRPPATCSVCGQVGQPTVTADHLARISRDVISQNFTIYPDLYPGYHGLSLSEVVGRVLGCADPAFCDLVVSHLVNPSGQESSGEEYFSEGQEYQEHRLEFDSPEDEREYVVAQWKLVALNLTHRQRFFNSDAQNFFAALFEEATNARENTLFDGQKSPTVVQPRAGLRIFRARRVDNPKERETILAAPAKELGAPPKEGAAHNRMNSTGVPLFYAATDAATCIAEVRPSIGDEVIVGQFATTKELRLFDFRGLDRPRSHSKISYFLSDYTARMRSRQLLAHLHHLISEPVRPNGHGYVVTQAMAEFLRYKCPEPFDGIIFRSVQAGGANYVIFNDPAAAHELQAPDWQPVFPVKHVGGPRAHMVTGIEYKHKAIED